MIPPTGWFSNFLLVSTLSVGHNAAKNLIFRVSSLLLQYTVFKLLTYFAYRLTAYTSFLMLLEDFIQKLYFISSYGFQEHSWIVLAFLILFPAAGVYDTCLWLLDAPGYVVRSTVTDAPSLSHQLFLNPPYVLNIPGAATEINLDSSVSAGLYTQNITLLATHLPISQDVVVPLQKLSSVNQPRIWLDNEGWSVGLDLGWPSLSDIPSCTPNSTDTQQRWSCHLNNTSANGIYTQSFGMPQIWWDQSMTQPHTVQPILGENTWFSLGPNGSSVIMKQFLTLTKGQRRHTLVETSWKATMKTSLSPFANNEILDFIRRAWNNDPNRIVDSEIQNLVDEVMLAQTRGDSFSTGLMIQEPQPFAIRATVIDYLTVASPSNASNPQFSSLRIRSSNTTLLRSEILSSSNTLQPFASCPGSFANIATGGQLRGTTCNEQGQPTMEGFKGQIDLSIAVILPNILGTGNLNSSRTAFYPDGQSWLARNAAHLDELMATRVFIASGMDDSATRVAWQEQVAAISYLQLILVGAPALIAILSWILMAGNATSHYKHSFLAAVCATTHVSDNSCRRIGYLKHPPRIELKTLRRHVVIGTPSDGTLANVEKDQVVAYSMVTEPLTLPESGIRQAKGEDTPDP
ncbi:hypothetical protein AN958_02826 [Leucoagaricus sp. SymC.cos]|nr:hypothetical protein AN958_02826 [Leucoagaricus sp. SymC.cos]